MNRLTQISYLKVTAILCILLVPVAAQSGPQLPQQFPAEQFPTEQFPTQQFPAQLPQAVPQERLSPEQLDNLVAPVALYPDPLLSQVLAASTYPLEIVEAQQWLQQNQSLRGPQLMDAAKQQSWDPSVQALVAFPDVLTLLNRDVQWVTDLGNAFLVQEPDVMNAVQRMRAKARSNGRLVSTPQQVVTTDVADGQSAIEIQPADPQVIYVPVYNPVYVWGPPVWGAYPSLWYPSVGYGFGFGPAYYVGAYYSGFGGWGGWGWSLNWFGHGLYLNGGFFSRYGYRGYSSFAGGYSGRSIWAHDPGHRLGVSYPRGVASRYGAAGYDPGYSRAYTNASRYNSPAGQVRAGASEGFRSSNGGSRNFSGNSPAQRPYDSQSTRGSQGNYRANPSENYRNFSNSAPRQSSASQSYSAPAQGSRNFSNSAPRQNFSGQSFRSAPSQSFSAPRSSSFSSHDSSPRSSPSSAGHNWGGGYSGGGSRRR